MQSQNCTPQKKRKFNPWRGIFKVLDKLSLKKQLTRFFIFHPPKPSYAFVPSNIQEYVSDPYWEFKAQNMQKLEKNTHIKARAYKLYRQQNEKSYMTPLLWLINENSKSEHIVLYSHGNSSDLGTAYSSAVTFANVFNMNVVAYDYTGYGLSPHKPSEKNLYADIESVMAFIVNFLNYPLDKIILCGFSLGTGPTVEMAVRYKSIPFMILLAPLASCLAMVEGDRVAGDEGSKHDIFANLDKMPRVACDIIFVHGLCDSVIPSHHSTKMFQRYTETHNAPKNNVWLLEVEDTDHHQLVQELGDPKTEFRELFMQYFEFLVENNHNTYGSIEGKTPEWEAEKRNAIETVRRKTNATASVDGVEECRASFINAAPVNRATVMEENCIYGDEVVEIEKEDIGEEKKDQGTRAEFQMRRSCFNGSLLGQETAKLREVFKKITVNKTAQKSRKGYSRAAYEEQLKSVRVFL